MGVITIIEGPDCSGKTTLQKRLIQSCPGERVDARHCGPPGPTGPFVNYAGPLINHWVSRKSFDGVLYDRFLYGELVYGPILRPHLATSFGWPQIRMLERVMLGMQGVLITAITDLATSKALWLERLDEELFDKEEIFDQTWRAFDQLFNSGHVALPMIKYDIEETSMGQVMLGLQNFRAPENLGPGIGMFKKGVTLVVGEQVNKNAMLHADWPFVANGGSSLWLAELLHEAGINENQLYWINAMDANGEETSDEFIEELRPAKIVALGKAAEIWCKDRGLHLTEPRHLEWTFHAVPHPQFWKRFHSGEPYELVEVLR